MQCHIYCSTLGSYFTHSDFGNFGGDDILR